MVSLLYNYTCCRKTNTLIFLNFRPSSSAHNYLPLDYIKAEEYGQLVPDCKKYIGKCWTNFSDLIYWFAKII